MTEVLWPNLAAGVLLCLAGWVLYWAGLHLTGALTGACFGLGAAWLAATLFGLESQRVWIAPVGGAVGFALGIFLIRGLHRFFFFLAGATLGMGVGHVAFVWADGASGAWHAVSLVAGTIVGGLAMVYASRWVVALVTSLAGSLLIAMSVTEPLMLLLVPPLAIGAFFFQIGVLKRLMPAPARQPSKPRPASESDGESSS